MNKVFFIYSFVYGYFCAVMIELSSCNRDCMACNVEKYLLSDLLQNVYRFPGLERFSFLPRVLQKVNDRSGIKVRCFD